MIVDGRVGAIEGRTTVESRPGHSYIFHLDRYDRVAGAFVRKGHRFYSFFVHRRLGRCPLWALYRRCNVDYIHFS